MSRLSVKIGMLSSLVFLSIVSGFPSYAAGSTPAILERGPLPGKGIPFLEKNAIQHFYGEYTYDGLPIRIWYTREPLLAPGAKPFSCRKLPLVTLAEGETLALLFSNEKEFMIFQFEKGFSRPCDFISAFLSRLAYFQGITEEGDDVPFPAIIEF